MRLKTSPFLAVSLAASLVVLGFILLPLVELAGQPSAALMVETMKDPQVRGAIGLSLLASGLAGAICLGLGTPLAWFMARRRFPGKRLVEGIIDLPIMIPHPVIGIAILGLAGRDHWIGRLLLSVGVRLMGSLTALVVVLTFVGLPFYINTVKNTVESIPERLEKVSRNLGATPGQTFLSVTLPLAWRGMLVGLILAVARAISEFGAVAVVAYHPMVAPVLIYERFTAYGLEYSQPVAVWLIAVCLGLFVLLRLAGGRAPETRR